jgi:hypothetical protein
MTDLRTAAQQALEVLQVLAEGAEEECGEETCHDCRAWRPVWATIAALKTALTEEALQRLSDVHQEMEAALEQPAQKPVAWLYPEGLEALQNGKCWTAYGTKQDAQCSVPVYLNGAVAPRVEPAQAECAGFDSQPAPQSKAALEPKAERQP